MKGVQASETIFDSRREMAVCSLWSAICSVQRGREAQGATAMTRETPRDQK